MKLTLKQIQHINREAELNDRIIKSRPTQGVYSIIARQEALRLIIELANIKD